MPAPSTNWAVWMRVKNKKWSIPFIEENKDFIKTAESLVSFLPDIRTRYSSLNLEIGCGKGNFLVRHALKNPDRLYIGVEKVLTVAAIAGKKIKDNNLGNVILVHADAEKMLADLPDNAFEHIFLNFSDPWPKKKHVRRRLTDTRFVENYWRILREGGLLKQKTDNLALFESSLAIFRNSRFALRDIDYDYHVKGQDDEMSEYEENFRSKGNIIYRLVAERRKENET